MMKMRQKIANRNIYIPEVHNYVLKVHNMFTIKEKKILKFLMTSFEHHSINELGKECDITSKGAYKIVTKLEKLGILKSENIANIKSYKINFDNELITSYLELALLDERINLPKIKIRKEDFNKFKEICDAVVIFGSYLTKEEPHDLDVLFVFEKKNYNNFKTHLKEKIDEYARFMIAYPIHDIIQTPGDLTRNIKDKDKVIIEIIRYGIIMFGNKTIARCIINAHTK